MAQTALLLGVKAGKLSIIDQGDPRDIRVKFKTATSGQGFESWEVYESSAGRTRKKSWAKSGAIDSTEGEPAKRKGK